MNTFVTAVEHQQTTTTNGMSALVSSSNKCVDLFYKIAASRGMDIIPDFVAAYVENAERALRIALWTRDVRGGAGEREIYRSILRYLERANPKDATKLIYKTPELGRWDDILVFETDELKTVAYNLISKELAAGNKLVGKWLPREKSAKKSIAIELMQHMNLTPKQYRKILVNNTDVVETQMCASKWDTIKFSAVPSVASARYRTAFKRNCPEHYKDYISKLVAGDATVKINASAIFPHDIIAGITDTNDSDIRQVAIQQWNALPNYIGDSSIFPMVDVSGSMSTAVGSGDDNNGVTCMDVAIALGIYCSDKNTGAFKDLILTFSSNPQICKLEGDVIQKMEQLKDADWGLSTDLSKAFDKLLKVAQDGNVDAEDMPQILLILSDMQFDSCNEDFDNSAIESIQVKYARAGYTMPQIVFWNISKYDNVPVGYDQSGVAMVSGFSPAILTAILKADFSDFTPESIMLETIMNTRYDV